MKQELIQEFESQFAEIIKTNSIEQIENFLLTSCFKRLTKTYRQSVIDYFVYSGYENEQLAHWALQPNSTGLIGNMNENADRPLRLACQFNENYAKYLLTSPDLKSKPVINYTNDGSSALLEAIKAKNLSLVQFLISSPDLKVKARIDIGKKAFNDPLCKACDVNSTEIVKYLLSSDCYHNPKKFNAKINLSRFDYDSVRKIIYKDNIDLFKFIVEDKLLDILPDLHNWFCKAVIADSVNIAGYLETFFEVKPNLSTMKYDGKSLFFMTAQANHNSRMLTHSYLDLMLKDGSYNLCPEEMKEISNFYVYKENSSAIKLLNIINIYQQKDKFDNQFPIKNIKEKKHKI